MERLDAIQSESISFFSKTVDESKIDQVDWNSDDFSRQFMEEVEVVSARKKIEAMEKMVKGLQVL